MAGNQSAPVDRAAVLKNIQALKKQLDALSPHINAATTGFGDENGLQARYTALKNALAKAEAAYSA